MIPDYIQNLIDELNELAKKHNALIIFMHESDVYRGMPEYQQHQLVKQEFLMEQYREILLERLVDKGYLKHD